MKTTAELQAKLEHLRGVHPKEIGARVGETIELIEEVLRLQEAIDSFHRLSRPVRK